jgi:hypothetical protein
MLKRDFKLADHQNDDVTELEAALRVFRERVFHEIENSVPTSVRYSEKIMAAISENR